MPAYIVTVPSVTGGTLHGVKSVAVFAETTGDAIAMAKGVKSGDSTGLWTSATATAIEAAADYEDWRLHILVLDPGTNAIVAETTTVGTASDTIDDLAALAVIDLNATASIAGAAYVIATNILTIAETTDTLGDHKVFVEMFPPSTSVAQDVAVPSYVGAITDEGVGAAALSVQLGTDAIVVASVPFAVE